MTAKVSAEPDKTGSLPLSQAKQSEWSPKRIPQQAKGGVLKALAEDFDANGVTVNQKMRIDCPLRISQNRGCRNLRRPLSAAVWHDQRVGIRERAVAISSTFRAVTTNHALASVDRENARGHGEVRTVSRSSEVREIPFRKRSVDGTKGCEAETRRAQSWVASSFLFANQLSSGGCSFALWPCGTPLRI